MTTQEIAPGDSERSIDSAVRAVCRVQSIDALRGLVMFSMIFVNDIAGVSSFCTLLPKSAMNNEQTRKIFSILSNVFRGIGLLTLLFLALVYRGPNNERILTMNQ